MNNSLNEWFEQESEYRANVDELLWSYVNQKTKQKTKQKKPTKNNDRKEVDSAVGTNVTVIKAA